MKEKGSHRRGEKSQCKVAVTIEVKFLELLQTIIKTCRILDTWRNELSVINPYILF